MIIIIYQGQWAMTITNNMYNFREVLAELPEQVMHKANKNFDSIGLFL